MLELTIVTIVTTSLFGLLYEETAIESLRSMLRLVFWMSVGGLLSLAFFGAEQGITVQSTAVFWGLTFLYAWSSFSVFIVDAAIAWEKGRSSDRP